MKDTMNGMNIRLLGCALALLILAAMSVYTGSLAKVVKAAPASAIGTQEVGTDAAAEDVLVTLL